MRMICTLVFVLQASLAHAQWQPPIAVPAPPFGIVEIASAPTIYVDEANGTDSNPGTAAKPRRSIPTLLPAGTVVQVIGTYTTSHESPYTLEAHGTAAQPVYILGGLFTKGGQLSGSYGILDGGGGPGGWTLMDRRDGQASDHLVVRHYKSSGGFATVSYYGGLNTDAVFWDVQVSTGYTGNQVEAGGDWHCIGVGKRSQRVWILDSTLSFCNGDGVQVNGEAGGQLDTGPVYIGRNTMRHNRQSGAWAKQSHDVVVSTNDIADMRPDRDGTNPGACGGGQYFVVRLVWVNNTCRDAENGIIIASYEDAALASPDASGFGAFGNTITDIHATSGTHDPANPRSPGGAIILVGASKRHLEGNIVDDVDGGIMVAYGTVEDVNNTVTRVRSGLSATPPPVPPPVPPPARTPVPPGKPACPHTTLGALGYIFGRCIW
jgi:hypothetical protein